MFCIEFTHNQESIPRGGRSRSHDTDDEVCASFVHLYLPFDDAPSERSYNLGHAPSKLWILRCREHLAPLRAKPLSKHLASSHCSQRLWARLESYHAFQLDISTHFQTSKKQKSGTAAPASEDTSHILGILSSLFSNIASDSPGRIRLLAKFVENNYEKVDKLLEIRDSARNRLKVTESEIEGEKNVRCVLCGRRLDNEIFVQITQDFIADGEEITSEEEAAWYLRRLDGGLFSLQNVDYILAWIAMEDDGVCIHFLSYLDRNSPSQQIRAHILQMLDRKTQSLQDIVHTLRIYHDNVDDEPEPPAMEDAERTPSQKEILQGLIAALDISTVDSV